MANKNSTYVQSLVDFLLDTKPYHSKLTEIVEEYRFFDEMTVHFDERLFTRTMLKAAWPYSYFSGGVSTGQVTSMHQLVAPNTRVGTFAFGSENTDLPLVPGAYDPKCIQGVGIAKAMFERAGGVREPIVEGHDIHLSHGAYTFQIHQTVASQPIIVGRFTDTYEVTDGPFPFNVTLPYDDADSLIIQGPATQVDLETVSITGPGVVVVYGVSSDLPYAPTFAEKRNEGLLAAATGAVQLQALDLGNPNSAINQIQVLLDAIAAQLVLTPNPQAAVELAALQAIIDSVSLPSSYEALINALVLGSTPVIAGYPGWRVDLNTWAPPYDTYVDQAFAALSTGLYFNSYTDIGVRESGALRYDDVYRDDIIVTNIEANPLRAEYEEWELEALTPTAFYVRGSESGIIGSVTLPGSISLPQISLQVAAGTDPMVTGTIIKLTPKAKVTIHAEAPLEAWSLIKVNPLSFSRPVLTSTRYGYLLSSLAERDLVTVLDTSLPSGTIVLTATSSTQFTLTSTAEPLYTASITVGTAFNDGRLAFTIVQGSAYQFQVGDKFYIELLNKAPEAQDFDLYYGFDMDPYDAETMVYNNVSNLLNDYLTTLDFGWDSRFTSYDLSSFNLQIAQNAVSGRNWRLRALRDLSAPQYELQLQNSSPPNLVSSIATNDPLNPAAPTQFDMPSNTTAEGPQSEIDDDLLTDLQLWYATAFELEYYDAGAWISVGTVPVGSSFSSVPHGISFTLVPAAKPFIAARLTSTQYDTLLSTATESVEGGDTISWTVLNEPAEQTEPAALVSPNATHLWIHGDSFHNSTPALWTLTWETSTTYRVQGVYLGGPQNGQFVYPTPGLLVNTADGRSYRNYTHGLHWTLYDGIVGQALGDSISFRTFPEHPTYLVHGSVSGWQPDATVDQWYWNGKIGFKITAPEVQLFEGGDKFDDWTPSVGLVTLESVRYDAPSMVYTLRSHVDGHWTMYRDGKVVADGGVTLRDQYVHLTMPPAVNGTVLVLNVIGDDHDLAMGNDLAIVRTSPGRSLVAGDGLVVHRTEFDTLQISVKPRDAAHNLALQPLGIVTTDLRFVDHSTLSGVPLSATSPEVAVLQGWIPLLEDRYDGASSEAVFSDEQTRVIVRAAGTGETIGVVESLDPLNPAEPVVMKWDSIFAGNYLPLNTEATIVTLGSGFDDRADVNITEGILFLLSGGGLQDSALFTEVLSVSMVEDNQWSILSNYAANVGVAISDGPFGGFLPGYDNTPYDFELGGDLDGPGEDTDPEGSYDAGLPLTDYFLRAQFLSNLIAEHPHPVMSPDEQVELQTLLDLLDPYLDANNFLNTTLEEFLAAINAAPPVNFTPTYSGFGIPAVGMGMEIERSSTNTAGAAVIESMTIVADDAGYPHDLFGYDVGEYDERPESTAIVIVNAFPLSVVAATTAPHGLSGLASVDGVTLVAGDVVLVKNQAAPEQNGLYAVAAGPWTRAAGFTTAAALELGREVQVLSGAAHAGSVWEITTAPSTVNVDPVVFNQVLTYNGFDAPLFTAAPGGRVIDLSLTFNYTGTPKVWVWLPTAAAPAPALVEEVSARLFRLSLPTRSEFKLIAG